MSGKGAPAAIYAALVSGILRSHAPIEPGPAEMLRAVNFSLGERRIDAQFVSLIYAVWNDTNMTLQVANSGLPRPIYCHKGKTEIIEATGCRWASSMMRITMRLLFRRSQAICLCFSVTAFWMPGISRASYSDANGSPRSLPGAALRCQPSWSNRFYGGKRLFSRHGNIRRPNSGCDQNQRWRREIEVKPPPLPVAGRPPAFSYLRTKPFDPTCTAIRFHWISSPSALVRRSMSIPRATIRQRFRDSIGPLGSPHTVCYSVKANSNLSILRLLSERDVDSMWYRVESLNEFLEWRPERPAKSSSPAWGKSR